MGRACLTRWASCCQVNSAERKTRGVDRIAGRAGLFFAPPGRYAEGMNREIYRGRIVNLRVERVTLPNGTVVDLELMSHPGAAAVVAADEKGRVVVIRQYRHAAGGYIWELPAGVLGPGEAPEKCAARELREEVGLVAERIRPLGSILTSPGFCNERIHLFLAEGLRDEGHQHEADEVIAEIVRMPLAEALGRIRDGTIVDGKTIAGLHLAAAMLSGRS